MGISKIVNDLLNDSYDMAVVTMMDMRAIYGVNKINYDANGDSIIIVGDAVFTLIDGKLRITVDHSFLDLDGESYVYVITSRIVNYNEFERELQEAFYYDAMYDFPEQEL